MIRKSSLLKGALIASGLLTAAHASKEEATEELSLASLFDMEVTVAAKSKERLVNTSGTVYVFSQEEFQQYGWRSVADVLQAVPGMNLSNNYRYMDGGQRGWGNDLSETIVMLNGREFTTFRNGRPGQQIEGLPLNNVKRIEVLQGPSSTLYGSHALQGAINIITETAEAEFDKTSANVGYLRGDVKTQQADFKVKAGNSSGYIGIAGNSFYTDRDWKEHADFFSNPANTQYNNSGIVQKNWATANMSNTNPKDYNNHEEAYNMQANVEYKGLYAGFFDYRLKNLHTPGFYYPGHMTGDIQSRSVFGGYKNNTLVENLEVSGDLEYIWQRDMYMVFKPHMLPAYVNDTSRWLTDAPALGVALSDSLLEENHYLGEVQRWDTDLFKAKGQANYSFNLLDFIDNNAVLGLEYWKSEYFVAYGVNTLYPWQDSDSKKWPNTETYRFSFYAQDQAFLFDEMVKLTGGFRVNKEKFMNVNVTPRFSASLEPIKNTVLKFNYTQGFRSLAFDQFAQATGEVDPTKMRQLEYGISNRLTAGPIEALTNVTYYQMKKLGNYTRKDNPNGLGVIWSIAEDSTEISGLEGQIKWSTSVLPEHKISGFIGANNVFRDLTPTADKNDGDTKFYNEYPEYSAKFGLSDQYKWANVGAFVDYSSPLYWEETVYNTVTGQSGAKVLKQQDAYAVLNLTLGVGPFDFMEDMNAKLTLQVNNVANEQYVQVIRRWASNAGMLQPPRNYSARLDFMF